MLGPELSEGQLDHAPFLAPSSRCMSVTAPSWSIGMPWTQEMLPQVPSGPRSRGGEVAGAEGSALSESCFCIQYRLCLPEESLPVLTSSAWVRGLGAGLGALPRGIPRG